MEQRDAEFFKKKLRQIYEECYIPELDRHIHGWDYFPEIVKQYYDTLSPDDQEMFRAGLLDLFLNGSKEWQYYLLILCSMLKLKQALPTMRLLLEDARKRPGDPNRPRPLEIPAQVLEADIRKLEQASH